MDFFSESLMKKTLKKAQKKAKHQSEELTEHVEDTTTKLYPIDKTLEEGADILVKYVTF